MWGVRRVKDEVWALTMLLGPWPGAVEAMPADLVAVSAAALGCLESLVEAPLAVTAVWLNWARWPPAQVPLTVVARLGALEAGGVWGHLEARRAGGRVCFTAAGLLRCGPLDLAAAPGPAAPLVLRPSPRPPAQEGGNDE